MRSQQNFIIVEKYASNLPVQMKMHTGIIKAEDDVKHAIELGIIVWFSVWVP